MDWLADERERIPPSFYLPPLESLEDYEEAVLRLGMAALILLQIALQWPTTHPQHQEDVEIETKHQQLEEQGNQSRQEDLLRQLLNTYPLSGTRAILTIFRIRTSPGSLVKLNPLPIQINDSGISSNSNDSSSGSSSSNSVVEESSVSTQAPLPVNIIDEV